MTQQEERRIGMREIQEDITEIKCAVKDLADKFQKVIYGNGSNGIIVKIDRNTLFRKSASKALWGLYGLLTTIIAASTIVIFRLLVK